MNTSRVSKNWCLYSTPFWTAKFGDNFEDNEYITDIDYDDNYYGDTPYGTDSFYWENDPYASYVSTPSSLQSRPTVASGSTSGKFSNNIGDKFGDNNNIGDEPPYNNKNSRTTNAIDWTPLDTLKDYENILDETLEEMNIEVDTYPQVKTNTQCQRYLKVKLVGQIKSNKETSITTDYVDIFYGRNGATNDDFDDFYNIEEIIGQTAGPVQVDTVVQIQSINEVSLNGEFMDATIALSMRWNDARLRWNASDYSNTRKIRALKSQVWIPDLNVVNRIHDFSPEDEKVPKRELVSYFLVAYISV